MPENNRDFISSSSWNRSNSENNLSTSWTSLSTPKSSPYNSRFGSPISSYPSSPLSTSPTLSPVSTLKRTYSSNSSTFTLIPEDREIDINYRTNQIHKTTTNLQLIWLKILLWCPFMLTKIFVKFLTFIFKIIFLPLSFATPSFWLSALLWVFWKLLGFPLYTIRLIFWTFNRPNFRNSNKGRTVLLSCGSTIQTLHLARNFYSSGARVVVFEFEGLFGLARFSTSVSKFYTIPRPTLESPQDYITALCNIVEKEKPSYYIPVCSTSPAYFDALAKPHLELLECSSFIPGLQETAILDDTYEMIKKCKIHNIPLAPFRVISSKDEMQKLYESDWIGGYRNIMMAIGSHGVIEHQKFLLPSTQRDFKINYEISEQKSWLVIRDLLGKHYVTCTTVKESQVIANVTCLIHHDTKTLKPEENSEITEWLHNFFAKIRFQRLINGHLSFRFVKCEKTNNILLLGSRVGVSLPYICYTGVHSRVLWKPCRHFSRKNSGPIVQKGGRYWMHEAILNTIKHPSVNAVGKLIETVIDKREALFVYWDPLPYCAYYHFQLPLKSIKSFLNKRQNGPNMATSLTAPVH